MVFHLLTATQVEYEVSRAERKAGGLAIEKKQLSPSFPLMRFSLTSPCPTLGYACTCARNKCMKGTGCLKHKPSAPPSLKFVSVCIAGPEFRQCFAFLHTHRCLRTGIVDECPFPPHLALSPRPAASVWLLPRKMRYPEHRFPRTHCSETSKHISH